MSTRSSAKRSQGAQRQSSWVFLLGAAALVTACSGATDTGGSQGATVGAGGAGQGGSNVGGEATVGTGGTSVASTSGTGGSPPVGCTSDGDCLDPIKPLCDLSSGACVGCFVDNDMCPTGQYCNAATDICDVGCADDTDCDPANGLICNTSNHTCVGCVADPDCPAGSICISNTCVAGCNPSHPCQVGSSCCGTTCVDLAVSTSHCGMCNFTCPDLDNAQKVCTNGQCMLGMCDAAYSDCNGDSADGCEWNTLQDGPCLCVPGATQSCYQGIPGSVGVGPCAAGTQTCDPSGTSWGACLNQILPVSEVCNNAIDDDCDGAVDNGTDSDGDGWTSCGGDCCDTAGPGCTSPSLINPGAFEVVGNGLDDDCSPATSDVVPAAACSTVSKFTTVTATNVANAMDICKTTTANPILPTQKTWGLISATQTYADGSTPPSLTNIQNFQTAVLTDYGTSVFPQVGATMAGISTGRMRDQKDVGYINPDVGTSYAVLGNPPAAYLAAHGGNLPSSSGCSGTCPTGAGANDSVSIKMTIRVPTNAQSFSYQFKFYSAEFPEWQCNSYNDFYLALLTSAAAGIPADKNISFDGLGNVFSVNNGFFDVCSPSGCNTCPDGTNELLCTGMQGTAANLTCAGALGTAGLGGGSKWLTTDAPIVPGEVMTLELMVFDVGDNSWDSLSLLDNFHWNLTPSVVGTHQ